MAQATEQQQLRFVDADELRGLSASLEGVAIVTVKDEAVGSLDGLLVDEHDRPYYLTILSSATPAGRYLLPIGLTWFDDTSGVVRTDVTPGNLSDQPAFDPNDYRRMSPEESWQYERRVLTACCPETLAEPGSRQDHYNRNAFKVPAWLSRPKR